MKNLLTLMIIFGLAAVANAGLIFTIDGEPQPAEIWLEPSEAIELDLELGDGTIRAYQLVYELSNNQAELITTGYDPYPDTTFPALFDLQGGVVAGSTAQRVEITAGQLFTPDLAAPQTLMVNLVLHCLEPTDVVLTVTTAGSLGNYWDGNQIAPGEVVHTLIIHQTPEPMTVALLGLGGLFLRRRK